MKVNKSFFIWQLKYSSCLVAKFESDSVKNNSAARLQIYHVNQFTSAAITANTVIEN